MQLKIVEFSVTVVEWVGELVRKIGRRDPDLARQLRRSVTSVPLNLAEGESASGGNRRVRFETAMGSARESKVCLQVAVAMKYMQAVEIREAVNGLDRIVATVTKLNRRG